jgi:putative heme-binding domain-containing protein
MISFLFRIDFSATLTSFASLVLAATLPAQHVLLEAEQFAQTGGWDVDQQFMEQMGSSYLLAHGLGVPVKDATTTANDGFLPNGSAENANAALYAQATAELAQERKLAYIDIFSPTQALFAKDPGLQYPTDGARLSPAGTREVATLIQKALFASNQPPAANFDKLRAACADKAWVHAQDYRMLNGWYFYGGRRTHDTETFPKEYAKIRAMVAVRDKVVWELAQGRDAKPDDSQTGELFTPKSMFGTQAKKEYNKPVAELLAQLTEYEPRTRYRARRELRDRPTAEVLAAIKALNPTDDRLMLECLWVQQGHHAVDAAFLAKVLRARTPEARAAATRVLADEWDRLPNAMTLIKPQITDEFARTRVEAIRAMSFVQTNEAVETVLLAADQPRDYWIDYTLNATLAALEPVWKPLAAAKSLQASPAGLALITEMEQATTPNAAAVAALKKFLAKLDMPAKDRHKIAEEIANAKGIADNGKAVFRCICIACHKWGGEGIEYGPAIDGLAKRMKREDIVESILEPSAQLAPQYITTTLETKSGESYAGFIAAETAEVLTLKVAGGVTQTIKVQDIKKRESLKVSSMPEGLANTMSPEEFVDLIEFLAK